MTFNLSEDWSVVLNDEFQKPYFTALELAIRDAYDSFPNQIFPAKQDVFSALNAAPFTTVKVVILGQDPYPTKGHAHGLSFSVNKNVFPLPKSLQNISKELRSDVGSELTNNGDLTKWATQGVLLLNSILTVKESGPGSHAGLGWELFTDAIIRLLSNRKEPLVFILWGAQAISKKSLISGSQHLILTSPHPSPLSAYRGFFGCKHFSKTNDFLESVGSKPIDW
jgi:uracil-DNA glycosylase